MLTLSGLSTGWKEMRIFFLFFSGLRRIVSQCIGEEIHKTNEGNFHAAKL